MPGTLSSRCRRLQSLDDLCASAEGDKLAGYELPADAAIDRSRLFVCPTATPLYYTAIYHELTELQQRRYNQLCALSFNELVTLFESDFAARVLAALARSPQAIADEALRDCLLHFAAEEQHHTLAWRELNRLSEPQWYANKTFVITRPPPLARGLMRLITSHPLRFPVIFWVMLALEEKAIDVARRCQHASCDELEPHYRAVYARHARDEARHVQIDWHLIERFYAPASPKARRRNAWLFSQIMGRYFVPPQRAAMRVVSRLMEEFPALGPWQAEFDRQLRGLTRDPAYHAMMYSRRSTPILMALLDEYPEMRRMQRVLLSYAPSQASNSADVADHGTDR